MIRQSAWRHSRRGKRYFIPVGTTFDLYDQFRTQTDFHGAQIGLAHTTERGYLTLVTRGSVALGGSRLQTAANGETVVTVPSVAPVTSAGGLLAQPSNIGTVRRDEFAVLPEAGVELQCRLTKNLSATFGYSFAYLNQVARVGEQLDHVINSTQIGGGTLAGAERPTLQVADSDLWVQGLHLGAELEW